MCVIDFVLCLVYFIKVIIFYFLYLIEKCSFIFVVICKWMIVIVWVSNGCLEIIFCFIRSVIYFENKIIIIFVKWIIKY